MRLLFATWFLFCRKDAYLSLPSSLSPPPFLSPLPSCLPSPPLSPPLPSLPPSLLASLPLTCVLRDSQAFHDFLTGELGLDESTVESILTSHVNTEQVPYWKCLARSCRFLKDCLRNTLQLLSYKNLVKILAIIWQVHTRFKETYKRDMPRDVL